jgi:DNA invertase Pin-like site-specific DNA recombinase
MKYFLYARKSTDEDDRQVLSIEAQLTELREFAKKENLEVVEEFIESKTAKVPGRSVFNKMIEKIELGGPFGIAAWHPDRLARNSIDGGKIIYLVDTGKIATMKFPTFWFDATPQGKFMLNIAFGQSKYYIDNLSENIKRGIRQKLRRGELPSLAPVGYLNELRHHTIVKDPDRWKAVRALFEAYAT